MSSITSTGESSSTESPVSTGSTPRLIHQDTDGSVHSNLSILEDGGLYELSGLETISESSASAANQQGSSSDELSRFYPRWKGKPVYYGNPEALGWALDTVGRAIYFIGLGAFLGTALLQLAREAAGCEPDQPCTKTINGMKPSSLLTTYTMIVGVVTTSL